MLKSDTRSIAENVHLVRTRIQCACELAGRDASEITLVAVSKTKPAEAIREASRHGIRHIGENYLQEALEKRDELGELDLCWHYIGRIQSSKTRDIATHFDWVHAVDRLKVARRLSAQRPDAMAPLNICLQVNVSGETSKSGIPADALIELAREIVELPALRIRGIMGMPAADSSEMEKRNNFAQLAGLLERLRTIAPEADTLSMGMSGDLEAAIEAGATMVRVGRAIFGERHYDAAASGAG